MPRHSRIIVPGLPVHAIQRGNNRSACFVDDEDRTVYLRQMARLSMEEGCALHAYCLMTNHVHLLLTPERQESCEGFFRRLSLVYVQHVNRKYRRTGALWEGRFRSCLVESERYLFACYRYVELNPVRAGMVKSAVDYRWSSHRANAHGETDACITPHPEYIGLGQTVSERCAGYRETFRVDMAAVVIEKIRATTNSGYALGSKAFRLGVSRALGRRVEPGEPGRPPRVSLDDGTRGHLL